MISTATTPLYYVPSTAMLKLRDGTPTVVVKGVRTLPADVADDPAAVRLGVKPEHEMTASERASEGLEPPLPDVSEPSSEPVE